MPTAAKLVAGIALALVALGVAQILMFRVDALKEHGVSYVMFATVGFIVGWSRLGPAAQGGYRAAWVGGLAATVTTVVSCTVLATFSHIYKGLAYHAYQNVDDLIDGFFKKALEYGLFLTDWPILGIAVFGALTAATFAAFADRLWS